MSNKGIIITLAGTVVLIGILGWVGSSTKNTPITFFKDTHIACLTNGHQRIAEHVHPILTITVDGQNEVIPANVGIDGLCMSELHTHDATGTLHAESVDPGKIQQYTLADFFGVWDKNVERDGYELHITQDGETKESIEDVALIDHSVIELTYTSSSL